MLSLNEIAEKARSTPSLFDLSDQVALVVGGTRGLGQAMALALAAAGADVCIVGRGPEGLSETVEAIGALGRQGSHIAADVTDESQVQAVVDETVARHGRIDILLNSQGAVHLDPTTSFDTRVWQRIVDVNLKSVFLCCKHVGATMLERGSGKIINVSSVRGFQGRAQDPAYAPTKGAVNQLTRSLAIEWGSKGINVNGIAPVFTRTAMSEQYFEDPTRLSWVLSRIPMKRVGELEDLFGPVVFLASAASDFVNGHTILVDGGWVAA